MPTISPVLNTHHPRARETSRVVVLAARELPAMERAEWLPVLRAWEAFSKALTHHMHEEEELMLDRVQLFAARKMLVPGALHASRGTFEELFEAHSRQHELARAVRDALEAHPISNHAEQLLAVAVIDALAAFDAHVVFEDTTLRDALSPYLAVHSPEEKS
jgi:hypothetical protein